MSQTITSLTALRGLACLAVIAAHQKNVETVAWASAGGLGVNFFFALSGFLLIRRACDQIFDNKISWNFMKAYLFRRVCRIYPAYLIALVFYHVMFVLDWYPESKTWEFKWTAPIFGTRAFHLWTIEFELMYYFIMFPVIVITAAFLIAKSRRDDGVSLGYIVFGIVIFILVGVLLSASVRLYGLDPLIDRYWMFLLGTYGGFFSGARQRYYPHIHPSQPGVNRFCNFAAWALVVCIFFTNRHNSTTFLGIPLGSWIQGDVLVTVVYVLFMILLEFSENETSVGRGLQANFLVQAGEMSYSAYLIHSFVIITLNNETSLDRTDLLTCSIILIFAISGVLYTVEKSAVKAGNKFIRKMGWEIERKQEEKLVVKTEMGWGELKQIHT